MLESENDHLRNELETVVSKPDENQCIMDDFPHNVDSLASEIRGNDSAILYSRVWSLVKQGAVYSSNIQFSINLAQKRLLKLLDEANRVDMTENEDERLCLVKELLIDAIQNRILFLRFTATVHESRTGKSSRDASVVGMVKRIFSL